MDRRKQWLTHAFQWMNRLFCVICCGLLLLIVGATFLQVFCRKVLNAPLTWTEEFSRLAFVWMNCIGCAIVIRYKQQICFEILTDKIFSSSAKKWLRVITDSGLIVFFIWVIQPTFTLIHKMNTTLSAALQWPSGLFYLGFAVGVFAILLAYVADVLEAFGYMSCEEEETHVC